MSSLLSRTIALFWSWTAFPFREVFSDPERQVTRAQVLVRVSYAFCFLQAHANFQEQRFVHDTAAVALLWPVWWLRHAPWETSVQAILLACAISALLAAAAPSLRLFRLATFVSFLEYFAVSNSYGKINHNNHLLLLVLLMLVFTPRLRPGADDRDRRNYLAAIWGAQALVLGTYTLAGAQKLVGAVLDFKAQGVTVFSPDSLAIHLAQQAEWRGVSGPASQFLIQHSAWGYPLMMGAILLELGALSVAFRPRVHWLWGVVLIMMHLGIEFVMGIRYNTGIVMVLLWVVASPFTPSRVELLATLRDVPWAGPLATTLIGRLRQQAGGGSGRTVVFYDGDCGMCNYFVSLCLRVGVPDGFVFAPLQGRDYAALAAEHPYLRDIDSVVCYTEDGDSRYLRVRSEAILWLLSQMRGIYAFAWLLLLIPLPALDLGYRIIARYRGSLFPSSTACVVPTPEQRKLFLE